MVGLGSHTVNAIGAVCNSCEIVHGRSGKVQDAIADARGAGPYCRGAEGVLGQVAGAKIAEGGHVIFELSTPRIFF